MHMHGFGSDLWIEIDSEPILCLGEETKRKGDCETHDYKDSTASRESHANSRFRQWRACRSHGILRAGELFFNYRIGMEAGIAENNCTLGGQVLVDLQLQTRSNGRCAVPSRASSAAYASAA